MQYWLLKTEPETFSYDDLLREGQSHWDGVRNYAARNHLKAMAVGDFALIYYSGKDRAIVGVARIVAGPTLTRAARMIAGSRSASSLNSSSKTCRIGRYQNRSEARRYGPAADF